MSTKSTRFFPRLEVLGDRSLPSVSYQLTGTILTVTGDAGANTITITDIGTADGVLVVGDGNAFQATSPINSIVVQALGGDDTVVYDLTGPLAVTRLVSVDLGRGADTFTADLTGQTLGSGVNLGISADGGHGGDTLVLNAQGLNTNSGSILTVSFSGDAGKDIFLFNYSPGELDLGTVIFQQDHKH